VSHELATGISSSELSWKEYHTAVVHGDTHEVRGDTCPAPHSSSASFPLSTYLMGSVGSSRFAFCSGVSCSHLKCRLQSKPKTKVEKYHGEIRNGYRLKAMQAAEAAFDGLFSPLSNYLSHGDAALGRRVKSLTHFTTAYEQETTYCITIAKSSTPKSGKVRIKAAAETSLCPLVHTDTRSDGYCVLQIAQAY